MKVNCQDYRASMELLGLRRRLEQGVTDPDEEKRILERIQDLERELHVA
jgi:uncharacterized coiled-coil DUF342 family protein